MPKAFVVIPHVKINMLEWARSISAFGDLLFALYL